MLIEENTKLKTIQTPKNGKIFCLKIEFKNKKLYIHYTFEYE